MGFSVLRPVKPPLLTRKTHLHLLLVTKVLVLHLIQNSFDALA